MILKDFSEEDKKRKKDSPQKFLANRGLSVNLGLKCVKKSENEFVYKADRWCGCCWLKNSDGSIALDDKGNRQILEVKCRFDEQLRGTAPSAVINMISVIADDEEFSQYLCTDLPEEKRLLTFFTSEDFLPGGSITEDNRLVAVISFLTLLERITRRFMIRRTIRQSENLTGNIRGKILINKHISQNLARGREDRIYCQYTVKTVDTPENRFLKYALKQADAYLREKNASLHQKMHSQILACCRRFSEVSDVRCSDADLDRIILPGMYAAYHPALQLARVILTEISMTPDGKNENSLVVPYAVNMPLLFECYARARIRKALNKKSDAKYEAVMLPFVPDSRNVTDVPGGYRPVFCDTSNCYIRGNLIPDIVIAYREKGQPADSKPAFYRVYDVKYKDREKSASNKRDDRLQILAYDFMYLTQESVGHIFPKTMWFKEEDNLIKCTKISNREQNCKKFTCPKILYFTNEYIGRNLSVKRPDKKVVDLEGRAYLEFYLGGGEIEDAKWLEE